MRLGCIKDIQGACAKFEQIDNRKILKKRDIKDLEASLEIVGLSPGEISGVIRMLARFAVARNPWYAAARMILTPSDAGGPCGGPAFFDEDGKNISVSFYSGDKFVKKKDRPEQCKADFDIWNNDQIVNFFSSPHQEQLNHLKDKSTCHYMQKINKLVAEENAKDSSLTDNRKQRGSSKKNRGGRH